jgi:hypothetical protein
VVNILSSDAVCCDGIVTAFRSLFSTSKMDAGHPSEMLVTFYKNLRRDIEKYTNLHTTEPVNFMTVLDVFWKPKETRCALKQNRSRIVRCTVCA